MGSKNAGKINLAVRAKYVEWCKVPKNKRKEMAAVDSSYPVTKEAFATKYGVNRATIWRWEQDAEFKREVANEALGLITADELAAMIAVQKEKALNGDIQSFKLLAEWSGIGGKGALGTVKPKDDDEEAEYLAKLSDEELEAMLASEEGWEEE